MLRYNLYVLKHVCLHREKFIPDQFLYFLNHHREKHSKTLSLSFGPVHRFLRSFRQKVESNFDTVESVGPIFKSLPQFFFQLLLTLGLVLILSLKSRKALKEVDERGHLHLLSFGIDNICDDRVVECIL